MEKELILMVGPIGSGKTTFAKTLVDDKSIRISQDEMGRKKYLDHFHDAISDNIPRIIVDRMNFNKKQRERFIAPAKKAGYVITIFEMKTPIDICINRVVDRKDHPTVEGDNYHLALNIMGMYSKEYEKPTPEEFDNYNEVQNEG